MADRITQDPSLEVIPDHAGPFYDAIRTTLIQNGMTAEQAIEALNASWNQNHEARIQRWNQQVVDDANAEEEAQRQAALQAGQQQEQEPRNDEQPEVDKKKAKMNDFDDAAVVDTYIAPRPAQYALRRIEEFDYVELWYLTPEGCSDASQSLQTQSDDAFGITKIDDMISLRTVSALKASKNVIPDAQLTFRQMSMAKNTFVPLMSKYKWPDKAVNSMAHFFTQLEMHPYRQRDHGERALVVYQARVRRDWHDRLKQGTGFNIGIINEDLLQSIYRSILDEAQLQALSEVSTPRLSLLPNSC